MNKKYFETRTGSLEDVSTKIATEQPTLKKDEPKVKLTVEKSYFDVKPGSLADAAAKVVSEDKDPCWKDYEMIGTKKKDGKEVPNCVPKEETIVEFSTQQIKQAYGILNDPRYKQGNYDGAVKAIEKLAKGLSKHKDVANALKRANEEVIKENPLMALGRTAAAAAGAAAGETAVNRAADAISNIASNKKIVGSKDKKSFSDVRKEQKLVKTTGKTATGKKAAVIDVEPSSRPI